MLFLLIRSSQAWLDAHGLGFLRVFTFVTFQATVSVVISGKGFSPNMRFFLISSGKAVEVEDLEDWLRLYFGLPTGKLLQYDAWSGGFGVWADATLHPAPQIAPVVSVSPQESFLHQVSELDTLGVDRPESKCRLK